MIEGHKVGGSVLMAVYGKDRPDFLDACLHSLQMQTVRADEVILVEDGPLPISVRRIIEKHRRELNIISVPLALNVGLGCALNQGLMYCTNDIVIRMDADDIAVNNRIEIQLAYMVSKPSVVAVSSWIEEFDENGYSYIRTLPISFNELVRFAKWRSPLAHPSSAFKRGVVLSAGGYPPLRRSQDYALWAKLLMNGYIIENIPQVLLRMRIDNVFGSGRGWSHLLSEWEMFRYQKSIGFISLPIFLRNFCIRVILRLSPIFMKQIFYKFFR
jgi:amylovoran biosynthesis glycosyltransferase AmsE